MNQSSQNSRPDSPSNAKNNGGIGLTFMVIFALGLSFGAGYQFRDRGGPADGLLPHLKTASLDAVGRFAGTQAQAAGKTYKPDLRPYETFEEVRRAIKENYVKTEINETQLTYGAVRGMLRSLDDRFTRFMTPEEYAKFNEDTNAEFTGIGARIDIKDDYYGSPASKPYGATRPYIVEPIDGGPAAKANLQKNDVILEINGKSTAEMSVDATVAFIKGERGTPVKLKIERRTAEKNPKPENAWKVIEISLVRDIIEVHPVKLEWLPERIAWIRLDEFNKKSDGEMTKALQDAQKGPDGKGPAKGIVFDMRNNPGGLLDVAVDISSRFVKSGPVVYTKERTGQERSLDAESKRFLNLKMPIVILINNYSASASEIVAGALKDKGLATVVGEHSYGKASVQVLVDLKNGGALVITTAKYLTPSKRDISEKGIVPDVTVKASAEDDASGRGEQLQKAIALIKEKTATAGAAVAARAD
jgi:carboxyl-terminal processing protease